MREAIMSPSNAPGSVGKFRPEQIATRATWRGIPDSRSGTAQVHEVNFIPRDGTTVVHLNPLDPGTTDDVRTGQDPALGAGWLDRPADLGRVTAWPRR